MKKSVIDYFAATVREFSNKIAVVEQDQTITFAALALQSQTIAANLARRLEAATETAIVAFYLPKSISCVAGNIGCSLAGAAYMNLDLKAPEERLRAVVQNVQLALIVTDVKHLAAARSFAGDRPVALVDELNAPEKCAPVQAVRHNLIDTDLYCLINTSGSTGIPKSVALNHRSFLDFMAWTDLEFPVEPFGTVGSLSPVIFDIYSFELCLLIMRGSTLVLIPENLTAFPVRILEQLERHDVSFIFWVPTIMVNIANLDLLRGAQLDALKLCWFAGEVFPTQPFKHWQKALPHTEFVNLYGPIEITLDCTFFRVNRILQDDEPIPIGHACENTGLLLLNESNQLCDVGEEGEICVRGTSLALGYYNNWEKTKAVFVQNPLNTRYPELIYRTGDMAFVNPAREIIYSGRKDTLIKHLGYRIELAEIEHILINKVRAAKNGCVVYDTSRKEIVLYYEPLPEMDEKVIRLRLAEQMPKYMVPTRYIRQDEMPLNSNGKIDRQRLKEQLLATATPAAPMSPISNKSPRTEPI